MELSYRGAHYEAHLPKVEASTVEEIGLYRGAPVKRRHVAAPQTHHERVQLTYRGVKYSHDV